MKERFVEYCDGDRIEVDVLEKYHFKEGTVNDGYVIEERGFNYGCQKTKLKDRNFTHWYKLPFIKYDNVKVPELGDRILKNDTLLLKNDFWSER